MKKFLHGRSRPYRGSARPVLYGLLVLLTVACLAHPAPVQEYVPGFPEKRWPISTRQLMSHTAGIRHYGSEEEVLSSEHYDDVFRIVPHRARFYDRDPDGRLRNADFGWGTKELGELPMIGHGGSSIGGRASLMIFPEKRMAISVMSNVTGAQIPEPNEFFVAAGCRIASEVSWLRGGQHPGA